MRDLLIVVASAWFGFGLGVAFARLRDLYRDDRFRHIRFRGGG